MSIELRPLRLPEDYEALASLLNTYRSEPCTAQRLEEDDAKLYTVGHTYLDENGLLAGYDRTRRVAVTEQDVIVGYVWSWRAPWTEPGHLNNTLIVAGEYRRQGAGQLLLEHVIDWGTALGATTLVTEVWDDHPDALQFAERRGFAVERHAFQSVLDLDRVDPDRLREAETLKLLESGGLRFLTLADEPGEESERKLYELYKETLTDIPGYTGEVPDIQEWRKWYLMAEGYAPERVIIAADGDNYAGVTNVLHNRQTNGMYHEYTGVKRAYRRRKIALGLKIKAMLLAKERNAAYIRTDNDSMNAPILRINRSLGYEPLRGTYRLTAKLQDVARLAARN
ncbi:GNAT family N-acetyltransferase [Paenibacillus tyrfis]|uniref:GNAT family N-acetyltransferase n=1 Tax=Paenibacillus tyrfis TaxID=1501230 RepID=UPI002490F7DD|nr:GNAT family N-acetyltransferase [Paenibacillus tyrfis]GLI08488.1 GNAT family N-acetyltransferase [Paenibacillus tyrfis]